jgi:3-methyladenine DNA glycosylase AlkD
LERELRRAADPTIAANPIWFKTGKGEYANGDKFIGVRVPLQRAIAARYASLDLAGVEQLLNSPIHEYRFTALLILVARYETGNALTRRHVFDFYLDHTRRINNWDLVDISAPPILGEHLVARSRRVLYRLAESSDWWERRISIIATAAFIQRGDLKDAFAIAKKLLADPHDLIHKAVGWMLREAGSQSRAEMLAFIKHNYSRIPRTTLRYAIEHLPATQRKRALAGRFTTGRSAK